MLHLLSRFITILQYIHIFYSRYVLVCSNDKLDFSCPFSGVKNFLNFATKCYRMWILYTSLEVLDISTCNFSLRCQHIIQQRVDERRGLSAVQGVDVTLNSCNFFERKYKATGRESFELDFKKLTAGLYQDRPFFKSNQYWLHRGLECIYKF